MHLKNSTMLTVLYITYRIKYLLVSKLKNDIKPLYIITVCTPILNIPCELTTELTTNDSSMSSFTFALLCILASVVVVASSY